MIRRFCSNRILTGTWVLVIAACLAGCQGEPTATEKAEVMLTSGSWSDAVVVVDGVDYSNLYSGFAIQFNLGDKTYTSSGGAPLWPASGTWRFTDDDGKHLQMDGKLEVEMNVLTDTDLEIAFVWESSTFTSGRSKSVGGRNVFKLKKH